MSWLWGLLGALIYAGPRWVACYISCRESGFSPLKCALDFIMSLAIGAVAAAAFSAFVLTTLNWKDENAVSALIGLFVHTVAPELNKRAAGIIEAVFGGLRAAKGDDK